MQLRELLHCPPVKLDRYGLEIEIEFKNYYPNNIQGWRVVGDGSLRGHAAEYVSRVPRLKETLVKDMARLVEALKEYPLKVSDRCGIHIHTNLQNLKVPQAFNFLILYYMYEDLLIELLSPERKANVFCMRVSDAEALIDELVKCAKQPTRLNNIPSGMYKYAALNYEAISRFGTAEFRALSTPTTLKDFSSILEVVDIFHNIKMVSKEFPLPNNVIEEFSSSNPEIFTRNLFPTISQSLVGIEGWEDTLFEGMRRVQEIAFSFRNIEELPKAPKKRLRRIAQVRYEDMFDTPVPQPPPEVDDDGPTY